MYIYVYILKPGHYKRVTSTKIIFNFKYGRLASI